MFIYQVRRRVFRHEEGQEFKFPASVVVRFHLKPLQPFGMEISGGRTAVRGVPGTMHFDLNTGAHTVVSDAPLVPLDVVFREPDRLINLQGNVLTLQQKFNDLASLAELVEVLFYCYPLLLNVTFADPPYVESVDGTVGEVPFQWNLAEWTYEILTTTQKQQSERVAQAWERFNITSHPQRRRLVAALHYFYVACRLGRCGNTAGEFLPEVVLNLAKTLQVLFPSRDDTTIDAARTGLKELGYTNEEIESQFVPAIALRSSMGVAHVQLALFKMQQLRVVHAYTEQAETAFRGLLARIFEKIEAGDYEMAPYELKGPDPDALKVIARLRNHLPANAL